jgi:CheY-like chemotaxis protein
VEVFSADLLMRRRIVEGLEAAGVPARGAATERRLAAALEEGGVAGLIVELDGVAVDGETLVRRLKADPATEALPLLGFCGHTQADLIRAARAAGADRVVSRGELHRKLATIAAEVFGAA